MHSTPLLNSHGSRSIDCSWNFLLHRPEEDGGTPGVTGTLSGCRLGWAVLRREQGEQFESKHHENRATGRKARPITDVTSAALGREDGSTPVDPLLSSDSVNDRFWAKAQSTRSCGNEHTCNNRVTVGNGVFYVVCTEML
jgi:hypothetical protein